MTTEKQMERIRKRNAAQAQEQIKEGVGTCGNEKPCAGPVCNQWDRIAEQCGVRSIGEAATILLEVFGPQILATQGVEKADPELQEDNKDGPESQDSGDENIT